MRQTMDSLLGMELGELEELAESAGEGRFRGRQMFQWMYRKGVFCTSGMKNLPQPLRTGLAEYEGGLPLEIVEILESTTDTTRKYVFRLKDGKRIESVLIPLKARLALCLSTQVGCAMGCIFCRTGRMGLKRDLSAGEILAQYYAVRAALGQERAITHVVFMGMGEPLVNYSQTLRAIKILMHPLGPGLSPRRITLSTVGIIPVMESLLSEVAVNLTVSLNASESGQRTGLMPINRVYPLDQLAEALKRMPLAPRKRFTIAYVMLKGMNDSPADAVRLAKLLHGIRCKVNLIPFNPFPSSDLEPSSEESIARFQQALKSKGISTYVRVSKGRDILGACGQLSPIEGC